MSTRGSKNGEGYQRVQPQRTLKKTPEKGFLYRKKFPANKPANKKIVNRII